MRLYSIIAASLLLLPFAPAIAQTNLGGIGGTVQDITGAVVPGASVTVTNLGSGRRTVLTTSGAGTYTATTLDPVFYSIKVELTGFNVANVEKVKVDTATTTTVNVTLSPGSTQETITVTGEAPALSTESGSIGRTVTEEQIVDLPLDNRSVLDLAMTVPNISGEAGTEDPGASLGYVAPGSNINVNGGRPGSTAILADGVNNTGVGASRAVVTFSPDVVQEFTVQSSAFSAEYGQTGGGVINVTTRSGTNSLHGTLYWFNRNPAFNAAPYTTATINRPENNRRQNQFGAIAGGPVVIPRLGGGAPLYDGRNRTFFFVAVEPRYSSNGSQENFLLPDEAMRRGDFRDAVAVSGGIAPRAVAQRFGVPISQTVTIYQQFNPVGSQMKRISPVPAGGFPQFAGNIIPTTYIDPVSQKLLSYLPPTIDYFLDGSGNLRNFAQVRGVKNKEDRISMRFDHQVTSANRLNLRLTTVPIEGNRVRGTIPENVVVGEKSASQQVLLGDTHVLAASAVNDLRLNFTLGDYSRSNPPEFRGDGRNLSTELGLPSLMKAGLPSIQTGSYNIGQQFPTNLYDNVEESFNLADTLALTRGSMTLKIGADIRHQRMKTITINEAAGGTYQFSNSLTSSNTSGGAGGQAFATFLLGIPSSVRLRTATVPYYYRHTSHSFFFQDDWKVRPNIVLNLGLRYSLQLPRIEKYDRQGIFLPEVSESVTLTAEQRQNVASATGVPVGQVPATTLMPVFGFSGKGGRSRGLMPVNYHGFEPRLGFAWSPRLFGWNQSGGHTITVRGGYGLSHLPITGLSRSARPDFGVPSQTYGVDSGQADPNYALRLSSNPPKLEPYSGDSTFAGIPADGLIRADSINYLSTSFAISPSGAVPYVQNWNLTVSQEMRGLGVLEFAYVGSKGTHLFSSPINMNPRSYQGVERLLTAGLDTESTINDPLGRTTSSGGVLRVPRGTLVSPYMGVGNLMLQFDPSSNSIRHAGYVSVERRFRSGLAFTANYTFAKSIDDSSDQGEVTALGLPHVSTRTQLSYGGTRANERSVSNFDIKHAFASTFNAEVPVGRGRRWLNSAPGWLDNTVGGWQVSGVGRITGGYPLAITMLDPNRLGTPTSGGGVRPDLVPGVAMLNPRYDRNCPIGAGCEPYFNPAAFIRPAKGSLGNASRTYDGARAPWRHQFDVSVLKNFRLGKDSSKRLQIRMDLINALNHPVFSIAPSSGTAADDYGRLPDETDISPQAYNAWAAANNQPLQPLSGSNVSGSVIPTYRKVLDITQGARGNISSTPVLSGATLPENFFVAKLPNGFATMAPAAFDITTPDGLKLYRLREAYNTNFATLASSGSARVIQFGIKLYF